MSSPVVVGLELYCRWVLWRGAASQARPSVALLSSQVWTLTESRHKQGAVKHSDSFRKRPIHSNQGKQLQRHKFTSLLRFQREREKKKSLVLRRSVTVCQHINRVLCLIFSPILLFFSSCVVEERRRGSTGGFFWAAGSAASTGRGWRAKVKGCRVPRWSRVYGGGVVLQVLQV